MPNAAHATDAPLAAIDIGSNSFRLELARIRDGGYQRIEYLKESVRLGTGLDSAGCLTEAAIERGLDCLRGFAQRMQCFAALQVRAVATQTLREAKNRERFLQAARAVLGHPVELISGREEARLTYTGVAHLQPGTLPRLVIDIGGRSTEMILGRGTTPTRVESFAVGSVGLSLKHFAEGHLTASAFRVAQVAAGAELEEAIPAFGPAHWREALASSGTADAVSKVLAANGFPGGAITPAGLRWLIEECLRAGHVERLDLAGLQTDRRNLLPGGLALLYTLQVHFGIASLAPARGALRQGVIIDLYQRLHARSAAGAVVRRPGLDLRDPHDLRDASVAALQRRFQVDTAQATRVRRVALALYGGLAASDGSRVFSDAQSARELAWACELHELGMMVSHHDHHRHSAYLLAHADAPGFSQSQQWHLAALVLGQRGGLGKLEAEMVQRRFVLQVLALRLAAIKCHSRNAVDASALRLSRDADSDTVRLHMHADWLGAHPRTMYLLQQEALAWSRSGVLELRFEVSR
jgi:exopolyphosphatase / guanosine-5'-triphosphate,3'-diphosphate pyrophosphatase